MTALYPVEKATLSQFPSCWSPSTLLLLALHITCTPTHTHSPLTLITPFFFCFLSLHPSSLLSSSMQTPIYLPFSSV